MNAQQTKRRGISTTEMVLILAGIAVVAVVTIGTMGLRLSADLSQTAQDAGNPTQLKQRFGP